jgi:hypothetical protein
MYKNLYVKYQKKIISISNQIGGGKYIYKYITRHQDASGKYIVSELKMDTNDQNIIDSAYERCKNGNVGNIEKIAITHNSKNGRDDFEVRFKKLDDNTVKSEIDTAQRGWVPLEVNNAQQQQQPQQHQQPQLPQIPNTVLTLGWQPNLNEQPIEIFGMGLFIVLNGTKRVIPGKSGNKITDFEHATLIGKDNNGPKLKFHQSFIDKLKEIVNNKIIVTLDLSPPNPNAASDNNGFRDTRNSITDLIIDYLTRTNQMYSKPHGHPAALINISGNMNEYNIINNATVSLEIGYW